MLQLIVGFFHSFPHLNFNFKWSHAPFDLNWHAEYAQSLYLLAALCGAVSLLLLLTVVIAWICTCCARADNSVKPRRKVRRLSILLFFLSVLCFFCLGFCVFGNDQANRGVSSSIVALADVNHAIKIAQATGSNLNEISRNASTHIKALEDIVYEKGKETPINQTVMSEIDSLLTQLGDSVESVQGRLGSLKETLSEVSFLEYVKNVAEAVELDRWLTVVFLTSIMMCVFFLGVIAFCRQSKCGAIIFSGLGLFIFLVACVLLALALPATVGLADFCSAGGPYLSSKVSRPLLETLAFYSECNPRPTHDNLPPNLGVANMSDELSAMQTIKTQLDALLTTTFNSSAQITKASALINNDGTKSLKLIGALEAGLACYAFRDDLRTMKSGLCSQTMIGASVTVASISLLVLFLFTLLLIVSKSWNLFARLYHQGPPRRPLVDDLDAICTSRTFTSHLAESAERAAPSPNRALFRGSDYIEVDEDDPFFPRANDSNIPVDIYGTHVFNSRTRSEHLNEPMRDRTEPSTGTTSATANGGAGEADPLWSRNAIANPSAPNATLGRGPYDDHYGNYQDHYNV